MRPRRSRRLSPILCKFLALGSVGLCLALVSPLAQSLQSAVQAQTVIQDENQLIREFELPSSPPPAPVYRPAPAPVYSPPPPAPAPAPVYSAPEPVYEAPAAYEPRPLERQVAPAEVAPAEQEPENDAIAEDIPSGASGEDETQTAKAEASGPLSRYILEFNRSPIVGNRLQMRGVYSERRLGFTRPRGWDVKTAKALIRYQHSPDLLPERSNLIVRVNGTSVGSVPLTETNGEIGEFLVDIPANLVQDYTEITLVAQQNNDKTCSDPADPMLWTEVMPDSKIVLDYEPQAIALDFASFPYPFFDPLALDANRVTYVMPKEIDQTWMTAAARFQASMGRQADYRPLTTNMVEDFDNLAWNDRLVVIGTPENQPLLKELALPINQANGKFFDSNNKDPLPDDVGVLMLATVPESGNPVLIISGNGPKAIERGIQTLQSQDGSALSNRSINFISNDKSLSSPEPRNWPGHLPTEDKFTLSALKQADGKPFKDVTVRASSAPPIEIDFHALGDDYFLRGNAMKLVYSYGPGLNSRNSTVEVALDDVTIAGQRLGGRGGTNETFNVNLPENLIKPDSKLRISFQLNPKDGETCGIVNDNNLWATIHSDTSFNLNREVSVDLPNLELARVGFPFAAPQDLSSTSLVTATEPSRAALMTLLEASERLGRLSQSKAIQISAYPEDKLPTDELENDNLILVGSRDELPLASELNEKAQRDQSLILTGNSLTGKDGTVVQTLDGKGIIQQVVSPWNKERVVLALTGQSDSDLSIVQQVLEYDTWFLQLEGDTVLVSRNDETASPFDPNAYEFKTLQVNSKKRLENVGPLSRASRFLQERWLLLPVAVLGLCLLMYGISQIYLKRVEGTK